MEKNRSERLKAREERQKERHVGKAERTSIPLDNAEDKSKTSLSKLIEDSSDILSSIQILDPVDICVKCRNIVKDPTVNRYFSLNSESCKLDVQNLCSCSSQHCKIRKVFQIFLS